MIKKEKLEKSDIFFGVGIILALTASMFFVIYIASAGPENPANQNAIICMGLYLLSWIGIYLAMKFEKTQQEAEDEEMIESLEIALNNQKNMVTLKEELNKVK